MSVLESRGVSLFAKPFGEKMIKVMASKVFPSKATLTKFEYVKDGKEIVFYVRENGRKNDLGIYKQVLELCAPEDMWVELQSIVKLEDSLGREVYHAVEFTPDWAETNLFVPTINGMPKSLGGPPESA